MTDSQQQQQQLLRVIECVREINGAFSVASLERVLETFRSWVSVDGVEGGFALAPDELDCVLGFPDDQRGVAFLVDAFNTHAQEQIKGRVDLVTLLVAIALLSRGSLEEKAKFVFTLVDLDTEDDIVEEELALVVSACSNGLERLGVHSETLLETDALAIAYEAFEFVGVEDGEKMSFACFLRWCVFHDLPRALFERISYLCSMSTTIVMLQQALPQLAERANAGEQPQITESVPPAQETAVAADTPVSVQVGPVIGWVTSHSAKLLLECDAESEVSCVFTDRIMGDSVVFTGRTRYRSPVVFCVHGLSPGRIYDVSFRGLVNSNTAILQTPYEDPVLSWTLAVVSDDRFLDKRVRWDSMESGDGARVADSFVGDIAAHLLPISGGMFVDATLHLGVSVCLAHDLSAAFRLHAGNWSDDGSVSSPSPAQYEDLVRQCVRRHWGLPESKELFSRGAHVFSSVGILRSLLTNDEHGGTGIPLDFLLQVRLVLQEYEAAGCGIAAPSAPEERYFRRLSSDIVLLSLDTLENIVDAQHDDILVPQFAQRQATLLSTQQWDAIEALLLLADNDGQDGRKAASRCGTLRLLVILCDIPLVWQDAERDAHKLWWKTTARRSTSAPGAFARAWSLYPLELDRLLQLIFRKKQQDPAFNATIVCCGTHASRTTIRDTKTKLEVEQVVLGPISAMSSPSSSALYSSESSVSSTSVLPPREGKLLNACYSYTHEFPANAQDPQQYCVLKLVAHPRGSTSSVHFLLQHQPNARLILGPVIGRVTPQSVRVLVELDRSAEKCVCVLTDTTTRQRFAMELRVEACSPTVFKMETLRPGSRYAISFEGILATENGKQEYVHTPPAILLASEWVVVHHNIMKNFVSERFQDVGDTGSSLPLRQDVNSHWSRNVQNGMRSYTAIASAETCAANGDTLGDHADVSSANFNPWFYVEEAFLSEPMKSPHLVVHLGGQVDMSRAFSDVELLALVRRIGGKNDRLKTSDADTELLLAEVRHRIQDVYRLTWGVPPLKEMLSYACNLMMLNEEIDLFFSKERLKVIVDRARRKTGGDSDRTESITPTSVSAEYSDAAIESAASLLRATAFEFWQRYQNQLWVDVNERDIVLNAVKNSPKFAFSTTLGICRLVFMNLTHEAHELRSTFSEQQPKKKPYSHVSSDSTSTAKDDDLAPINLFTNATWKTLEDALMSTSAPSSAAIAKSVIQPAIQQVVVVIPADFIAWMKRFPQLRPDMVRVFEKCFAWKAENQSQRRVVVICSSDHGSSLSYEVTDEKLGEKLSLSTVGSISEPREILRSAKATPGATKQALPATVMKGHFSKRFTYQSLTIDTQEKHKRNQQRAVVEQIFDVKDSSSAKIAQNADTLSQTTASSTASRTFASYHFLSDFRSGFLNESLHYFPPKAAPKATLGPVLGRIFFTNQVLQGDVQDATSPLVDAGSDEDPATTARATALILLEINADASVACIVTDSLANEEVRVVQALIRDRPHVFCIPGLLPERRYVYRFEGIYNASSRRGCFHTPCVSARAVNLIALSSNFPEQIDPSLDSLWVAILERVQAPWCGIDALLHLGGQVPLHEAAVHCFQWLWRELKKHRWSTGKEVEVTSSGVDEKLRRKVRKRFQQHYHLSWNLPHVREVLANVSNWFLPSQADVAPFLRNQLPLHTTAARLVLEVAKEVVAEYQLALLSYPDPEAVRSQTSISATNATLQLATEAPSEADKVTAQELKQQHQVPPSLPVRKSTNVHSDSTPTLTNVSGIAVDHSHTTILHGDLPQQQQSLPRPSSSPIGKEGGRSSIESTKHPLFVQNGELGFFFCDLRAVSPDDIASKITCNDRLSKPLTAQEHPMISEAQWLQLESALKRKKVLLFVLCMEFPLILTNAEYVNRIRDEAAVLQATRSDEEHEVDNGTWELYDHKQLVQHWVTCKRQLEQLLGLLFRWKMKHRGRDVLVLSGGVKVGLDTLIQETTRGQEDAHVLSLRNLTCGPITASVEPFEFPLSGVACPTFGGGAKDDRFTFAHRVVSKNNYLLMQLAVAPDPFAANSISTSSVVDGKEQGVLSANIEAEFVFQGDPPNDRRELDAKHPIDKYRRFPSWWNQYIPMGKAVFWDDSVVLKSESDAGMVELRQYVYADRSFSAALEVFYEKHHFAETARMEELRSANRAAQHFDLKRSLTGVFADLWKAIPEPKRQRIAYFLDPFVLEFLLAHVAPTLFAGEKRWKPSEAIELEFFRTLCQDLVFSACMLNLAVRTQRDDIVAAHERARHEEKDRAAREALAREQREVALAEEKTRLELLLRSDPEQYAKEVMAKERALQEERETLKRQKLELKKAARLRELEEERAIAKEQKQLSKLAETDPREYTRRQNALEMRVRRLQETRAQRAAEKARKQQQQRQLGEEKQ